MRKLEVILGRNPADAAHVTLTIHVEMTAEENPIGNEQLFTLCGQVSANVYPATEGMLEEHTCSGEFDPRPTIIVNFNRYFADEDYRQAVETLFAVDGDRTVLDQLLELDANACNYGRDANIPCSDALVMHIIEQMRLVNAR